jgi:hypothetical protein
MEIQTVNKDKGMKNNWMMYDDRGNATVTEMVQRIKNAFNTQPLPVVRNLLHNEMEEIAKNKGEIYDTEVRYAIAYELAKWASLAYDMKIDSDYWDL